MTFDVIRYLNDQRIEHFEHGYKWCSRGWTNIECPFCSGSPGPHLGFNIAEGYASCFRCGWHSLDDVIMDLEKLSPKQYHEACRRVIEYDTDTPEQAAIRIRAAATEPPSWPTMTTPLMTQHRRYLLNRRYDPWHLEKKYKIKATGPSSILTTEEQEIDYSYRIIIPIFLDGLMVSFQGRDWTGKGVLKYKACPKQLEMVDHKTILYNLDNCPGPTIAVVEGALDVWRLGDGAGATFGIIFTPEQITLLVERYERIVVIYDSESQAQRQALKLVGILRALGREAINFRLNQGDPGELSPLNSKKLMEEIFK